MVKPSPRRPVIRCSARPARGRARRVLSAFLKLRCEGVKPREEVFDASHVERMLRSGQSEDAFYYLQRFLYRVPTKDSSPLSWQIMDQVGVFKIFATVAAGGKDGAALAALYQEPDPPGLDLTSPFSVRLTKVLAKMTKDPGRASKIWQEMEPARVDIIMDLVSRCPELQGDIRLLRRRLPLWDSTTHGLCACPSRRRKTTNHAPSDALAREFLHKRLLTTQGGNGSGVPSNASSSSLVLDTQTEQKAPEAIILGEQPRKNLVGAPERREVMQV